MKKIGVILVILVALMAAGFFASAGIPGFKAVAAVFTQPTQPGASHEQVTLCHRTESATNPYIVITVDFDSVEDAKHLEGHTEHQGDIIPPYTFTDNSGTFSFPGQGDQAVLANGCRPVTTTGTTTTPPPPPPPTTSTTTSTGTTTTQTTTTQTTSPPPTTTGATTSTPSSTSTSTPTTTSGTIPPTTTTSTTTTSTPPGSPPGGSPPSSNGSTPSTPDSGSPGTPVGNRSHLPYTGPAIQVWIAILAGILMTVSGLIIRRRAS